MDGFGSVHCTKHGRIWTRIREAQKHTDPADPDPNTAHNTIREPVSDNGKVKKGKKIHKSAGGKATDPYPLGSGSISDAVSDIIITDKDPDPDPDSGARIMTKINK